jgi:hypothetical protein
MSVSYLFPPDDDASANPLTATPTQKRNTKSIGDLSEVMVIAALSDAAILCRYRSVRIIATM